MNGVANTGAYKAPTMDTPTTIIEGIRIRTVADAERALGRAMLYGGEPERIQAALDAYWELPKSMRDRARKRRETRKRP